jgi:deazaflavin-dependent oxidoreductase (nitroreductase family)
MVTTERSTPTARKDDPSTARPRVQHPIMYRAVRAMSGVWRPLAGHRAFPLWAVLHHRGRRSGREYAVPVGIRTDGDAYYIALPFGEGTQWVRNVLASGSCSVRWRGEDIELADPALIGMDEGAHAFPPALRWMMRSSRTGSILRLRRADPSGRRGAAVS